MSGKTVSMKTHRRLLANFSNMEKQAEQWRTMALKAEGALEFAREVMAPRVVPGR